MGGEGEIILSCVAAVAENGVIGRGGELPWRLKSDLRRFRKLTMGHPLIMGRKTFQSIGHVLDGRDSIVVTRSGAANALPQGDNVFVADAWREALTVAERCASLRGVDEIFVIGGAELFSCALPHCRRIYLTRVHGRPEGDVFWTGFDEAGWREVSRSERAAGPGDDYAVTDIVMERR